jgi:hypothetical protein
MTAQNHGPPIANRCLGDAPCRTRRQSGSVLRRFCVRRRIGTFAAPCCRGPANALERYPSGLNRIGIPESGNF